MLDTLILASASAAFACLAEAAVFLRSGNFIAARLCSIGFWLCCSAGAASWGFCWLARGEPWFAACCFTSAVHSAWIAFDQFRNWKDRRRVARIVGDKTRRLRDMLVRRMRRLSRPRSLRPVPA